MALMRLTDNKGNEHAVELEPGRRYKIGRAQTNDVILQDPLLSRLHAEVYEENGIWTLQDCGSSNGTFVDGQRVDAPVPLTGRKRFSLGGCRLDVESGDGAAAESGSEDLVVFADRPLTSEGTIYISPEDALGPTAGGGLSATDDRAELEEMRRRFQIVEKANLELLAHEPMDALLPKILDLVFEAVTPNRAALVARRSDGELVCRAFRGDGSPEEWSISRTISRTVVEQRVSVMTADAQADERFQAGASIAIQGIRAVMAVPLWNKKEVIGLIYADSMLSSRLFEDKDLKLLTMLANVAAIQIMNAALFEEQLEKRRFEREAQAAAEIQQRLLPRSAPAIPGYAFVGHNTPCHEVGGDYYDCLPLDERRHAIVVADVAGKGMGAAMLMAATQATLHAGVEAGPQPEGLVGQLDRAISRSAPSNRFVTVFLIELDREEHRLRYVNSGHAPSPVLVRAAGEVRELAPDGPPLGIFPGTSYKVRELELAPGDFVFACSDGVTDTADPDDEAYGEERLLELLSSLAGRPVDDVREQVETRLRDHAKGAPQPDDLTFVILQREA